MSYRAVMRPWGALSVREAQVRNAGACLFGVLHKARRKVRLAS